MISQYEVSGLLRREIPSLAINYCPTRASLEVYAFMNYFSDYTKQVVIEHEMATARKCFLLADKLFSQGDRIVKALIENIFVYSFSSMLCVEEKEKRSIKALIPVSLYSIYIKQVTKAGA